MPITPSPIGNDRRLIAYGVIIEEAEFNVGTSMLKIKEFIRLQLIKMTYF
jgi:hypothetical protein